MKKLHDGTSVADSVPTKLIDGNRHLLSQLEIDSINTENETEVTKLNDIKYQKARRRGYGSIQEQLDMQYWDEINGTTIWVDHITAIKTANPPPVI